MKRCVVISLIGFLAICLAPRNATGQPPIPSQPEASSTQASKLTELQKKADTGDPAAAFALGHAYEAGEDAAQNFREAALWYRKAAEHGNAKAQGSLGVLYWLGEGVEKDREQAVQWYRKAARQGDANAMFNLGVAYYDGEGVRANDTQAYAWFVLASDNGSKEGRDAAKRSQDEQIRPIGDAYFTIGEMYAKGEDLPQDFHLAEAWYRKAAPTSRDARVQLALLFLKDGRYGDALEWCKAAAKDGHSGGAFCLGYLYAHGFGVNQDLKAAFRWYEQAARGRNTVAMNALAQMYENGQATKVDRVQAMLWLLRAADLGNSEALTEARKLRSSMDEKEWKAAQKKFRELNIDPKHVDGYLQGSGVQAAH